MYEPGVLNQLISICKENDIINIADEVMTGFGRTGKLFACDHIVTRPDIICLSKAITGGTMPLGVTSCTQEIFNAFFCRRIVQGLFFMDILIQLILLPVLPH